jgi:hypothetical protein
MPGICFLMHSIILLMRISRSIKSQKASNYIQSSYFLVIALTINCIGNILHNWIGNLSVCMVKFLDFYFIFALLIVITPVLLNLAFIHYSETGICLWLVLRMFWLPSLRSSDSFILLHRDTCFNQFNYIVKCTIFHKKGINFTRPF